jgi:hypothetical protein
MVFCIFFDSENDKPKKLFNIENREKVLRNMTMHSTG